MLTAEARVQTSYPGRYLGQLCNHAAAMNEHGPAMIRRHAQRARAHAGGGALVRGEVHLTAECSDTHGVITLKPWGRCTISVESDGLLLSVASSDTESLRRIQDVITSDLERWGTRENLKVLWSTPDPDSAYSTVSDAPDDGAPEADSPEIQTRSAARHKSLLVTAGALGVALMIVVHLTLAGVMASVPLWLGWTAAGVMLVPALMLVVHAVGPLTILGLLRHTVRRPQRRPAVHVAVSGDSRGNEVVQRHRTSESRRL
jgi:hypothetical protein